MKFGIYDYVRDTTRHPKWHVSRVRGVIPTNGGNVKGLCFLFYFYFVVSLAQLGVNRCTDFDKLYLKMHVSGSVAFLEGYVSVFLIFAPKTPKKGRE